jgi:hypothetical protein
MDEGHEEVRMRTILVLGWLFLATALGATPVQAQVRFILSPYVGVFFYDDGALAALRGDGSPEGAIKVDPGRLLGARVGVELIRRLALIGTVGFAQLQNGSEDIGDFDFQEVDGDLSLYHVGLRFTPFPDARLHISGNVGVGGATTDFDLQNAESLTDVIVTAGVGAGFPINPHVSLRGNVNSVVEFCDEPQNERLTNCLEDAKPTHVQVDGGVEFSFF